MAKNKNKKRSRQEAESSASAHIESSVVAGAAAASEKDPRLFCPSCTERPSGHHLIGDTRCGGCGSVLAALVLAPTGNGQSESSISPKRPRCEGDQNVADTAQTALRSEHKWCYRCSSPTHWSFEKNLHIVGDSKAATILSSMPTFYDNWEKMGAFPYTDARWAKMRSLAPDHVEDCINHLYKWLDLMRSRYRTFAPVRDSLLRGVSSKSLAVDSSQSICADGQKPWDTYCAKANAATLQLIQQLAAHAETCVKAFVEQHREPGDCGLVDQYTNTVAVQWHVSNSEISTFVRKVFEETSPELYGFDELTSTFVLRQNIEDTLRQYHERVDTLKREWSDHIATHELFEDSIKGNQWVRLHFAAFDAFRIRSTPFDSWLPVMIFPKIPKLKDFEIPPAPEDSEMALDPQASLNEAEGSEGTQRPNETHEGMEAHTSTTLSPNVPQLTEQTQAMQVDEGRSSTSQLPERTREDIS